MGVAKGSIASPEEKPPSLTLLYRKEIWYTYVSCPDVQKSLLDPLPKPNRKSAILDLMCVFGDSRTPYFNELLLEISRDLLQIWSVLS